MKQILNSKYFIDKKGIVYNEKGKVIKSDNTNGGIIVNINIEGKRKKYPIWKLLTLTYLPEIKDGEILIIKDGDITNTTLNNLEIKTIEEIGRKIVDYEDYVVTKEGKIYSIKYDRLQTMATYFANDYEMIKLCTNNKTKALLVHRLVAQAYIPNPEDKEEIDHIDRNTKNNNYKNLRWVTRKENMSYCFEGKSPVRNFKVCILENEEGFKKEFKSKAECCRYAQENLGCSYSSLMKYGFNNGYKIKTP